MKHEILLVLAVATAAGSLTGCGGGEPAYALYCYRTLANVDCYHQPVVQDGNRLTGYIGTPPPPPLPPAHRPALVARPGHETAEVWDADQISR